jgi:hypothetical protein
MRDEWKPIKVSLAKHNAKALLQNEPEEKWIEIFVRRDASEKNKLNSLLNLKKWVEAELEKIDKNYIKY